MNRVAAAAIVVAVTASARVAVADTSERSGKGRVYHMLPVVGGGALYAISELVLKETITPQECRWCEPNAFDTAVRNAWVWDDPYVPNTASNLTGYLLNPTLAMGGLVLSRVGDPDGNRMLDDVLPVMQAGVATGVVNQAFKVMFGRQRPFVYFKGQVIRAKNDWHTSFFSGHTAIAFTMATSSSTVATLREYKSAPYLWAGGLALATATGYFRIAADAHYATDVLTGALIGGAIGVAVPLLFHRDVLTDEDPESTPRMASSDKPFILSLGGAF